MLPFYKYIVKEKNVFCTSIKQINKTRRLFYLTIPDISSNLTINWTANRNKKRQTIFFKIALPEDN